MTPELLYKDPRLHRGYGATGRPDVFHITVGECEIVVALLGAKCVRNTTTSADDDRTS